MSSENQTTAELCRHGRHPNCYICDLEETEAKIGRQYQCQECDGRGWVGTCTGSMFASIGRLAASGRLPTRVCGKCEGKGHE